MFIQDNEIEIDGVRHRLNEETNVFEPVFSSVTRKRPVSESQKRSALKKHRSEMAKSIGLTYDELEQIWEEHPKVCEICGDPPKSGKRLSVDHCHKMNKFRGYLCGNCNTGLGMFRDNIKLLEEAQRYLSSTVTVS